MLTQTNQEVCIKNMLNLFQVEIMIGSVDKDIMIGSVDKDISKQPQPNQHRFEVGCAVQYGDPVQYGTVKQLVKSLVYGAIVEWVSIVATVQMC